MDLQKIITDSGLKMEFVAGRLFPLNLHPYNALNRVMSKGGSLKSEQVKILSEITGLSADTLLGLSWHGKLAHTGIILSRSGVIVSAVNRSPEYAIWEFWRDGVKLHEISVNPQISVRDFVALLDYEINKLN